MKSEEGQSLVIVAILLVVLVGLLGLVLDSAILFPQKGRLQAAADAGALAGAAMLRAGGSPLAVEEAAQNFARRNGASSCEVTISELVVTVKVGKAVSLTNMFASQSIVEAKASARVEPAPIVETPIPTPGPTPTLILTPTPTPTPVIRLIE